MTTKDNGGTAFPGPTFTMAGYPNGHSMGMTLRDWFAGQALAGLVRSEQTEGFPAWAGHALDAYALADAMLEARGRGAE
jgi:hypothetical protein